MDGIMKRWPFNYCLLISTAEEKSVFTVISHTRCLNHCGAGVWTWCQVSPQRGGLRNQELCSTSSTTPVQTHRHTLEGGGSSSSSI